jgi:cation transport ATPase
LTAGAISPSVRAGSGTVEVTDERIFGPGDASLARTFARRILSFRVVRSLALDPARATATVHHQLPDGDTGIFLNRLADAIAAPAAGVNETELPHWTDGESVSLYLHSDVITIFAKLDTESGYLRAHHPAIKNNPAVAQRVENALRVVPGVIAVAASGELTIRFDPGAAAALQLIRIAEAQILGQEPIHSVPSPEPVNFGLENVMVGVAAAGEFVLPLVAPVASGLLVLAALNTFSAAASQLLQRKVGLPLLYTCAVGTRLVSGQFFAASVLSWFFRYWEHRYRQDGEVENQTLLDETAALPKQVRMLTAEGSEQVVPRRDVTAGQRVRALAGEPVPVDAVVRSGAALVDQTAVFGTSAPSRKIAGDQVFAGSIILAGSLDLEVLRTGHEMRVAQVARALIGTMALPPRSQGLNQEADDFASWAVAPTLLAAGAGAAIGGLTTAGAILSPDYATGVGITMPLEKLRDVRLAFRHGAVIRAGDALGRLATTSCVVLDDHENLHHAGSDVAELRTKRLDEARLLPAMAAAGVWLGDERGPALVRACRERGLIVRRAELREIGGDGVTIGFGDHLVRLRGRPVVAGPAPPPLIVEVDGVEVAAVRFVRNGRPEAAEVVQRLQQAGMRVLLTSDGTADLTAARARQLGVDQYFGGLDPGDKIQLLRNLQQQKIAAAYVGDCSANAAVAHTAHLSIGLSGADASVEMGSDIALVAPSVSPLPALYALGRDNAGRRKRVGYEVIAPNLLCVGGAFAFGFTAMAVVLISNFGTSLTYNGAKQRLRTAAARRDREIWAGL